MPSYEDYQPTGATDPGADPDPAAAGGGVGPGPPSPARQGRRADPELKATVAELRAALATKVEIVRGRKGGRITIEFYSDDDFQRLYELLIEAGRGSR